MSVVVSDKAFADLQVLDPSKFCPGSIAELKVPDPSNLCLGNINVSKCTNPTFGTKVDCHGNLIVNQYLQVDDLKRGTKGLIVTDSASKPDWKEKLLRFRYAWLTVILTAVFVTVACVTLFINPMKKGEQEDISDDPHSLNFSLNLRTFHQWSHSGETFLCNRLKIQPAKYVVLSHTAGQMCNNSIACESEIRQIQSDHMRKKFCNIAYNFLIGGDGMIYEGRGWGKHGAHTLSFNCDSIGVSFIGNFNINHPNNKMIQAFHMIIEEGLRCNEISSDYKLIGHKQVNNFASPGLYIEELMTKWDHWSVITKEDYLCN